MHSGRQASALALHSEIWLGLRLAAGLHDATLKAHRYTARVKHKSTRLYGFFSASTRSSHPYAISVNAWSSSVMNRFYLYAFFSFAAWTTLSLALHYFSASPWGGPLVISPDRMVPDAMFIEIGLLIGICLNAGIVDRFLPGRFARVLWAATHHRVFNGLQRFRPTRSRSCAMTRPAPHAVVSYKLHVGAWRFVDIEDIFGRCFLDGRRRGASGAHHHSHRLHLAKRSAKAHLRRPGYTHRCAGSLRITGHGAQMVPAK